jgi:hypothetical protein
MRTSGDSIFNKDSTLLTRTSIPNRPVVVWLEDMACNFFKTSPTIFSINSDSGLTNKKNTYKHIHSLVAGTYELTNPWNWKLLVIGVYLWKSMKSKCIWCFLISSYLIESSQSILLFNIALSFSPQINTQINRILFKNRRKHLLPS